MVVRSRKQAIVELAYDTIAIDDAAEARNTEVIVPPRRTATRESTFFRYKSIIGDRLRARHPKSQEAEALIAYNILNRMTELGRPESFAIGA